MIETPTKPEPTVPKKPAVTQQIEEDDWPLEEINKPLDSPEEYIKTETGPSLEE